MQNSLCFVVKPRRKRLGKIHRNRDYIDDFQIYYILTHLGVSSNVIESVCRIGVNNACANETKWPA